MDEMTEIEKLVAEFIEYKRSLGYDMCKGGGGRVDRYENDYDRREGRTMPETAFDKNLLFYD